MGVLSYPPGAYVGSMIVSSFICTSPARHAAATPANIAASIPAFKFRSFFISFSFYLHQRLTFRAADAEPAMAKQPHAIAPDNMDFKDCIADIIPQFAHT